MITHAEGALAGAPLAAVSRAAVDHSKYTPLKRAQYDPNESGRRCSVCGERGRWRRWTGKAPGGWFCCAPFAAKLHGDLSHTCTILCAGGAA